MRRRGGLALLLCVLLTFSGCGNNAKEIPSATGEIFAMDTYMTVTCYGERCQEAADAALAEIERLDALLSVGIETSEIAAVNRDGRGNISPETAEMIGAALALSRQTGGAFDITIYPLMAAWGFTTGDYGVPDPETVSALLERVDCGEIVLAADFVALGEGQGIDLGGIAKGFCSDRLMELFAAYDLTAGLVSLGGNVQCFGTKPDGSPWRVGIQDPDDPDNPAALLGRLEVADGAVITSGDYERYFVDEATGMRCHHILDPATGYPADGGLRSVTVVCADGMPADGLSTACFVMGTDGAIDYWRQYGQSEGFDLILMDEAGTVYVTEPIAGAFVSDRPVTVVTRD